jgi:hypothetical protein
MPVRRRANRRPQETLTCLPWVLGDGTRGAFTGDPARSPDQARRLWPVVRRAAWLYMHIGNVPMAARVYDGFTTEAHDALHAGYGSLQTVNIAAHGPRPCSRPLCVCVWLPERILLGLARDRERLAAHQRTPAAREIADVLSLFAAHLDQLDAVAEMLRTPADDRGRRVIDATYSSTRYGVALEGRVGPV